MAMSFGCKLVRGAAKVGEATLRCRSRESDAEEMERGGRAKNVEENESRSKSGWNFAAVSRLWGLATHQRKDRPLAKLKIAHDLGGLMLGIQRQERAQFSRFQLGIRIMSSDQSGG